MTARSNRGYVRFSFGPMGCGKSALALQVAYNLQAADRRVFLGTFGDRSTDSVSTRLGASMKAVPLGTDDLSADEAFARCGVLVLDEVQFASAASVDAIVAYADDVGCEVYAYGLLTNFLGEMFSGTQRFLEVADEVESVPTEIRCKLCGEKATHNVRLIDGAQTFAGEEVSIGDLNGTGETYELRCRMHSGLVRASLS